MFNNGVFITMYSLMWLTVVSFGFSWVILCDFHSSVCAVLDFVTGWPYAEVSTVYFVSVYPF